MIPQTVVTCQSMSLFPGQSREVQNTVLPVIQVSASCLRISNPKQGGLPAKALGGPALLLLLLLSPSRKPKQHAAGGRPGTRYWYTSSTQELSILFLEREMSSLFFWVLYFQRNQRQEN